MAHSRGDALQTRESGRYKMRRGGKASSNKALHATGEG